MRKLLNWLFSYGVPLAYACLISVTLALSGIIMMGVVLFAKVLDKIR